MKSQNAAPVAQTKRNYKNIPFEIIDTNKRVLPPFMEVLPENLNTLFTNTKCPTRPRRTSAKRLPKASPSPNLEPELKAVQHPSSEGGRGLLIVLFCKGGKKFVFVSWEVVVLIITFLLSVIVFLLEEVHLKIVQAKRESRQRQKTDKTNTRDNSNTNCTNYVVNNIRASGKSRITINQNFYN